MLQRSPIRAPVTSTPASVRFSPNDAGSIGAADLGLPPRRVLARVGVAGLVRTAVVDAVGLLVARQAGRADGDRAGGRAA
jgi:hypothetical protein